MSTDKVLREQLLALLRGQQAHKSPDEVLGAFPVEARNQEVAGVPYTAWQMLEHIRITQWDILQFIRDPEHESPQWPDSYWPRKATCPAEEWNASKNAFLKDLRVLQEIAQDPKVDLYALLPLGEPYTILRELLLAADHNAYHLGQLVVIQRALGHAP